jgi:hypothetical protein
MSVRTLLLHAFALFSAAMLGLAAGAVWMVLAMYLRHPAPWLALPLGAMLAWTIRTCVRPPGRGAALMAAAATLLATLYVNMGMGLIEAMRTAGAGMLWQLARMALSPGDFGYAALGMLLAAWLAWRKPRQRSPNVS